MLKVFTLIRKYSFLLIVFWMGLYAFDLIDDLQHNYSHRSSTQVGRMLLLDFTRFLLVVAIWVAANFDPEKSEGK